MHQVMALCGYACMLQCRPDLVSPQETKCKKLKPGCDENTAPEKKQNPTPEQNTKGFDQKIQTPGQQQTVAPETHLRADNKDTLYLEQKDWTNHTKDSGSSPSQLTKSTTSSGVSP